MYGEKNGKFVSKATGEYFADVTYLIGRLVLLRVKYCNTRLHATLYTSF